MFIRKVLNKFKAWRINRGYNDILKFESSFDLLVDVLQSYDRYHDIRTNGLHISIKKDIKNKTPFSNICSTYRQDINKIIPFIVDGNDVAGKETFCHHLANSIEKMIDEVNNSSFTYYHRINTKVISFPSYDTSILGELIKVYLRKPNKTNLDRNILTWLFILDRKNEIRKRLEEIEVRDITTEEVPFTKYHVFIFDRFYYSNLIYSNVEDKHIALYILEKEIEMYAQHFNPKTVFIISRDELDKENCELHNNAIKEKGDKDLNETIDKQIEIGFKFREPFFRSLLLQSQKKYKTNFRFFKIFDPKLYQESMLKKYFYKYLPFDNYKKSNGAK